MIKADHALHVRARQIQHIGDQHDGFVADVSKALIDGVQDGHQRTFQVLEVHCDLAGRLRVPMDLGAALSTQHLPLRSSVWRHSSYTKYRSCPWRIPFLITMQN